MVKRVGLRLGLGLKGFGAKVQGSGCQGLRVIIGLNTGSMKPEVTDTESDLGCSVWALVYSKGSEPELRG